MKRIVYAFLMLSLFSCQKENPGAEETPVIVEPAPVPPAVCKVASIREYPAVEGNNIVRTFTYDAANRVIKMDIQNGTSALVTKTITYNSNNKIEKITYNNGTYEQFVYTNGIVTGFEAFDAAGKPTKKNTFKYDGSKMIRESRYNYDATASAYVLKDYLVYDWDANGNIATVKTYSATDVVKATDVYAYHTDKLNQQQTITPQLELLFMNWSNDITAFINSKNLLKQVTSKSRNLDYQINGSGWVTAIKTEGKDLFTFTYGCSN